MKLQLLLAAVWCTLSLDAQTPREIDSLLSRARERDQSVRQATLMLLKRLNTEGADHLPVSALDSLPLLSVQTQQIDRENTALLTALLRHGLPQGLSPESYSAIWLISDHADLKSQRHFRPFLKEATRQGLISREDFATFTDRLQLRRRKPQTYGTQSRILTLDGRQVIYIWPIRNPQQVNRFRREVGLDSIEEYIIRLKEEAGCEVIYDPQLSIRRLLKQE